MKRLLETFIVEDDPIALEDLLLELKHHHDIIKISKIAKSYKEALDIILRYKFDLSILDIYLPEGRTCFDLIKNSNLSNFGIIALNSKIPLIPLNLFSTFKYVPLFIEKNYNDITINNFRKNLNDASYLKEDKYVIFNVAQGKIKLKEDDILYIQAKGRYCIYHFNRTIFPNISNITITETLLAQEKKLSTHKFFRVHDSYIANIMSIRALKKDGRKSGLIEFLNGATIPYSIGNEETINELRNYYP